MNENSQEPNIWSERVRDLFGLSYLIYYERKPRIRIVITHICAPFIRLYRQSGVSRMCTQDGYMPTLPSERPLA